MQVLDVANTGFIFDLAHKEVAIRMSLLIVDNLMFKPLIVNDLTIGFPTKPVITNQ